MPPIFIDRRKNTSGKSTGKRTKFLKRVEDLIKEQIPNIINKRKIEDIDSEGGKVRVSRKTITEPSFRNGKGGIREHVHSGNDRYITGDTSPRPPEEGGGGSGKKASDSGEGEDDFIIELNRDEFLDLLFSDMELPDLVRESMQHTVTVTQRNGGYTTDGAPCKLSVIKSLKQAKMRRISLSAAKQRNLEEAQDRIAYIHEHNLQNQEEYKLELIELEQIVKKLSGSKLHFLEENDLRYHNTINEVKPTTHAVMVMLQDVSGSMGEHEKTIARKSCWLLYMFLRSRYDRVSLRFVIHTTAAREVEEEEFFNTRESGGTVVSSGLKVVENIVDEYSDANVYVYQASDGDNFDTDNRLAMEYLERILTKVQYYAYTQIQPEGHDEPASGHNAGLWDAMSQLSAPNLAMRVISSERDIYPVFRKLFQAK